MNTIHPVPRSLGFTFFILSLLPSLLASQGLPFQVRLDGQPGIHVPADILVNEADEIVLLMLGLNPTRYQFIRVDGTAGPQQAMEFGYVLPNEQVLGSVQDAYLFGDRAFLLTDQYSLLSGIDLSTGGRWSRRMPYGKYSSMAPYGDGTMVVVNPGLDAHAMVGIYRFGPSGELLAKRGLVFDTPQLQNVDKHVVAGDSKVDGEGNTYFVGKFVIDHDTFAEDGPSILVKLDPQGNPVRWRAIGGHQFYQLCVADDGVYLLDKSPNKLGYNTEPVRPGATLVKFDHGLNLLWGREYRGEHYDYLTAGIERAGPGRLLMAHSTFGAFPVVLMELDGDGNILSQKGYPNFEPFLRVLGDGSLLFCSTAGTDGDAASPPVVTRTDTLGNTTGCPMFPTCLYAGDFWPEMDTLLASSFDPPSPDTTASVAYPITASFSYFCDYPPVPVPDFSFPDTLCQGDSASSTSGGNRLAQAREWHLTGPGLDSVLLDSFEFSFRFGQPGEYGLRQSVWVLGCRYDHWRSITVLPPLSVSIGDTLICPGEPMLVTASAGRPSAFTWEGGQAGAARPVPGSGTYAVTATDGHCTASATASVTVVSELLGGSPAFMLPKNTATCPPYLLTPTSIFTGAFFTDADPRPFTSLLLGETGSYRIGAEVFGCEFWDVFRYEADCQVDMYIPTSFSPNGDGINDLFGPFGQGFEVLGLSIYDRWGGLVSHGTGWDGGTVGQGAYAYELSYLNLLSGAVEVVHGEVTVLR